MLFKNIVLKFVSVLLIVALSFSAFSVSAATTGELNNRIAELNRQAKEANDKIESLQGDISKAKELKNEYQKQIDILEEQISTYEDYIASCDNEIKTLNNEIKEQEDSIEDTKTLLKLRVRAVVAYGQSPLSIILGNDSFTSYVGKEALAKSMSAYEKSLIDEINRSIAKVREKQAQIESKKKAADQANALLVDKQEELSDKEKAVAAKIKELYANSAELKEEVKKIERAKAEMEDEIARMVAREKEKEKQKDPGSGEDPKTPSDDYNQKTLLPLSWPCPGFTYITSYFGGRDDPFAPGVYETHGGIDISGSGIGGKPIIAAADGTVTMSQFNEWGYGEYVIISHGMYKG
ncbi:MAG: hypothetical protein KBS41_02590 [Oscillospiraceae bacterium]|nr:hypothetical protein [Candidatus Equicaccousia limihippi]